MKRKKRNLQLFNALEALEELLEMMTEGAKKMSEEQIAFIEDVQQARRQVSKARKIEANDRVIVRMGGLLHQATVTSVGPDKNFYTVRKDDGGLVTLHHLSIRLFIGAQKDEGQ